MMWSEKHRPTQVEQMIGNENARLDSVKWLTRWVSGSKPLLLIGPPGTGKTTLVHALARQFNYDLIEMNASDTRNKDVLVARISPIFLNTGIFGRKIMLFLDEVDGISGREDSGGLDTLVGFMKEPTIPVIMAANEKSAKIKELAKVCKVIEFSRVPQRLLTLFLNHVIHSEGIKLGPGDSISIVNNSGGDIRSMLNSAQSRAAGYTMTSNKDVVDVDIADVINGYFSTDDMQQAMQLMSNADASYSDPRYEGMTPEARRKDMLAALFSSIVSSQIDHNDLAAMLDVLSRADMIVGRAGRMREWRLLKYVTGIIANGLYEKSRNKGIKYSQYALRWPVMGPIFARSQSTRKIMAELAPAMHVSRSACGSFVLPYFIHVMIDNKVDPIEFAIDNFQDESIGESIAKMMEKASK